VLLNWKNNVKAEIVKINGRNENYQAGLNLLDKFILISVFNLLVLFALWWAYFFHGRERIWAIKASVYWLFFYLLFLLAAIFVKYEDRLFAPAAAILLTGDLYFLCSQIKTNKFQLNKIWGGAFIGMFVILSMMRVSIHREIAAEKKSEVKLKEKFIDSINKGFRGKIFLYDLWSQGLLHSSAFKNIYLDPVNLHTVFGDLPYHDFYSHQKYLKKEVCDYDKFIDFYDCVYDKREKVVFVMADFRRQMLQGYMKVLYERSYRFEGISDNSIKKIKYSFIWCPLSFDLCRIAK
jgi:hypothetical protein